MDKGKVISSAIAVMLAASVPTVGAVAQPGSSDAAGSRTAKEGWDESPERQSAGEVDGKKDEAGTGLGTVSAGSQVPIASEGGASAEAEAGLPGSGASDVGVGSSGAGDGSASDDADAPATGDGADAGTGADDGADAEEPVQGDDGAAGEDADGDAGSAADDDADADDPAQGAGDNAEVDDDADANDPAQGVGDDAETEDGAGPDEPAQGDADADEGDVPGPAPENQDPSVSPLRVEGAAADSAHASGSPLSSWRADTTAIPVVHRYTEDMDTEKFIALIGEQARAIAQEHQLYASVMIAQAILESGSGTSQLAAAPHNNLFGIKGAWTDGQGRQRSVSLLTSEDNGAGTLYQVLGSFRSYDTVSDSLRDYACLLRDDMGSYYQGAWRENASTYREAAQYLQGRYATDTQYAGKIIGLIETYELDRFDEVLDYKTVDNNRTIAALLAEATSHIGTPYVWGGASSDGLDCSGLIYHSFREAFGITLGRTTYDMQHEGEPVRFDDLLPGDLLFFDRAGDVYHVALYLGDGFYLHAPQAGEDVKVASVDELAPSFARRILEVRSLSEGELALRAAWASGSMDADDLRRALDEGSLAVDGFFVRDAVAKGRVATPDAGPQNGAGQDAYREALMAEVEAIVQSEGALAGRL